MGDEPIVDEPAPLDRLTSIRTKLGALVGVSVVTAAAIATLGGNAGVAPWLALPITVALALAVTQLLAVGMTSPLREMTAAATRMAGGDYGARVRGTSADEVGQLARAFNLMAADLGAVDRQRRDLVATVSHELRTPLAGLIAVLENLDDGVTPAGPGSTRLGVSTALAQAERLSELVRDLLDLSRLEAGAVALQLAPVGVRSLLEDAVDEARTLAREVTYDVRVTPAGLTVEADPARLHQLVANLLDNASRHSRAGGVVRVDASTAGDTWVLDVANAGDPIAPADRERIFARFGSLGETTGSATTGGTGLGLAIARWVTDLHGGTIAAVDPPPGADGAVLRAVLPHRAATRPPTQEDPVTTTPVQPQPPVQPDVAEPGPAPRPFGGLLTWPTGAAPAKPWLLAASSLVGVLAALLVVDHRPGLGYTLVLLAGGGVVYAANARRRDPFTVACAGLAAALVLVLTLRDAIWIGVLCALAATVLVVAGSTRARSVLGLALSGVMWPLAAIAGLPWLGRTIGVVSGSGKALSVVRTVVISLVGLTIFGLLFSSADAVFAGWLDSFVPDLGVDTVVVRVFVALAVAGLVLATSYFSLHPPQVEPDAEAPRRPTRHRYEWLAPVLVVDAVFVLFLVSQAAAIFGGHGFVERSTGLTYATYVHQGFGQLTVATLLTVLVVSVAARKAALATAADRLWLRGSLGALCVLTLLVVGSALHRLVLYTDSYGLTRLRLAAGTFEVWLGLLVIGLMVAGIGLRGAWLARGTLLSGAVVLLALALLNPDALVARTNVERFEATGLLDFQYADGLSADATPALMELDPTVRYCVLLGRAYDREQDGSGWEWNVGRWRERDDLAAVRLLPRIPCQLDEAGYVTN